MSEKVKKHDKIEAKGGSQGIERRFVKSIKGIVKFFTSPKCIPMLKGVLAYEIMVVLIFINGFERLSKFPATLSSIPIMILIGFPGRSIGASIQASMTALAGVCCGAVGFVILAHLRSQPVAQGFVFFIYVYIFALIKAQGLKFFPFALVSILVAFQGIYTSVLLGRYEAQYLIEFIKSYCWGAAIVFAVNILVLPVSSERELRRTLVASLEHISCFSHLLAKGYTLQLTEEEAVKRHALAQTIRADFGFLMQKIDETSIEVNFSRFSMDDYQSFVHRTRAIQQALITSYSSLRGVDKRDVQLFKEKFLPATAKSFVRLRAAMRLTIRDINAKLGCRAAEFDMSQPGYADFLDMERNASTETLYEAPSDHHEKHRKPDLERRGTSYFSFQEELADRLDAELEQEAKTLDGDTVDGHSIPAIAVSDDHDDSRDPSLHSKPTGVKLHHNPTIASVDSNNGYPPVSEESEGKGIVSLRKHYDRFAARQRHILTEAIKHGIYGGEADLHLLKPSPSLYEKWTPAPSRKSSQAGLRKRHVAVTDSEPSTPSVVHNPATLPAHTEEEGEEEDNDAISSHHSLMRVYSFIFSLDQIVTEIEALHQAVTSATKRRLHFHVYENLHRPHRKIHTGGKSMPKARAMGFNESIAVLEGKPYEPEKKTLIQRLELVEHWFRRPDSVFALKTAAAASVFAILLLVKRTQGFFVSYGLSGGALTIVTALSPTLGQSMASWVFQVAGSGLGYVYALIVLEIFRNIGGYHFNPFGITVLLLPYVMIGMFMLYERPKLFIAVLLALNATGVLLITEWVNVAVLGNVRFDSPALRMAKSLTTLSIALAIAAIFQLFVLRNPARKTLRLTIARLLFTQLAHISLLQAYVRALNPVPPKRPALPTAIKLVERELRHRELQIQSELIQLTPLLGFASVEPKFTKPFHGDIYSKLIRTAQIIHDRIREARTALGTEPLPDVVLNDFVSVLAPYRRENSRRIQTSLYLSASSMLSKAPMPSDPSPTTIRPFFHDALVLSSRFVNTPEGEASLRGGDFTKYFHYLMCITSLGDNLTDIEDACKELFGELGQQIDVISS